MNEESDQMKIIRQFVFAAISLAMLFSSNAFAGLKIDNAGITELSKVAVVGYSFFRWDVLEDASVFKLKRTEKVLADDDPDFLVMQHAGNRTMQAIGKGGAFTVIPHSEVVENPLYQTSTTDPEKKLALNWYFPDGYRVIKLKKANAVALCEALGVDAVVQIDFSYSGKGGTNSVGGISWGKNFLVMKGEITMIDKNGKTLVSGHIKSDKVKESSGMSIGDSESSGGSTEIPTSETAASKLYPDLLTSFLDNLAKNLRY
jgi:hypothetical protein